MIELGREVQPRWPWRPPRRGGADGLLRVSAGQAERLLHLEGEPAIVRVRAGASGRRVLFQAVAPDRDTAEGAIARMRFALGVDDDLRSFHERFRCDPVLGPLLRADPARRVPRRPDPFEALVWAITEQLIEHGRAVGIQRRLIARFGRRWGGCALADAPASWRLAGVAPAELEALGLSAGRARSLVAAARGVAAGRIELDDPAHAERGWRALRAVPGIGRWTVETLAVTGQGRVDQLPAGDLNLRKLVGRLTRADPRARADEEEVRAFFSRYAPWPGLAAGVLLAAGRRYTPWPARNSLVSASPALGSRRTSPLSSIQRPKAAQRASSW